MTTQCVIVFADRVMSEKKEAEIQLMKDFMDSFLTNVDSLFLINMGALIILMQAS